MFRFSVAFVIFLNALMLGAQDSAFVSPTLKRNKSNVLAFAGKTYYFGTVFKVNFFHAMQFCRQQGMQLVSINSQAENDRLGKFADEIGTHDGHFWTSGTSLADKNQWIWLSTGNNLVYSNWDPGEPTGVSNDGTNISERCLEARHVGKGYSWNDLTCEAELYFICESMESCHR